MRESKGLSLEDAAAQALDASAAKLSRIETGKQIPGHRDVRDLCRLYGASDERTESLIELAHGARQRGWWEQFDVDLDDYVGLETAAVDIQEYQPIIMPPLLQTPAYSAAYLQSIAKTHLRVSRWTEAQHTQFQRIIQIRQERILADGSGVTTSFVIEEGAFLRMPDAAQRHKQLEHVREVARRPGVDVRILLPQPSTPPPLYSGFINLTLPNGTRYGYVETLGSGFLLDAPDETAHLQELFILLQSQAEPPSRTDDILLRLAEKVA